VKPNLEIFVVEDHDDTTGVLCGLLRDWGHDVRSASTLSAARDGLSRHKADVLLSDIGLPDGDGLQLIKSLGPHVPPYAIAMSGYGTAVDRQRSLTAGYRHHLVKPFEAEALKDLLLEAAMEVDCKKPTS